MTTDDLIDRLGAGLVPVQPLPPPWRRAAVWFAWAVAYAGLVIAWAWARHGVLGAAGTGVPLLAAQFALLATAFTAATAAFTSVVPGLETRARALLLASVGVMMAALAWGTADDARTLGTIGVGREMDWPCVVSIALGGFGLWMLAAVMLRRGAPLTTALTSLLAGAAALSVANLEACVSRPHTFTMTVILWHGVTSAIVLMALSGIGRHAFGWRHARR